MSDIAVFVLFAVSTVHLETLVVMHEIYRYKAQKE